MNSNDKTYPVTVTISRSSDYKIRIYIRDDNSRMEIARVTLSLEEFAKAITSMPASGTAEYRGLDVVGKTKIIEARSVEYPHYGYGKREDMSQWLEDNCQEKGWILDTYLGSQGSVAIRDGKTILHYSVMKWV